MRVAHIAAFLLSIVGSTPSCRPIPKQTYRPSEVKGRILILPGANNTGLSSRPFEEEIRRAYPALGVDVQRWGIPLFSFYNVVAIEKNRRTAEMLAAELTAYRRDHKSEPLYVLGFSGGGGMAAFCLHELPDDVKIDRLILVAPAISPEFPLVDVVMPHVSEFAVNFTSERDRHVSWGTRIVGTMDRRYSVSAGFRGFDKKHPKLLEIPWHNKMIADGHWGGHHGYLSAAWVRKYVVPALDPLTTKEQLLKLGQETGR